MAENMIKNSSVGVKTNNVAFLLHPESAFSVSVMVGNTGVSNDSNGRKIIKAGTPIGGTVNALETRNTVLQQTNTSALGANTQGILTYEVDVTDGPVSVAMIVAGRIDTSRLPVEIVTEAKTQLEAKGRFIFVNGGAY